MLLYDYKEQISCVIEALFVKLEATLYKLNNSFHFSVSAF